jgi:hypothetical protein
VLAFLAILIGGVFMLAFLTANIGTIVVGLILLGIVGAVVNNMVKKHKSGGTSCGCGCEGCTHKCH